MNDTRARINLALSILTHSDDDAPVRMTLDSALAQLRAGGYGTPLETS